MAINGAGLGVGLAGAAGAGVLTFRKAVHWARAGSNGPLSGQQKAKVGVYTAAGAVGGLLAGYILGSLGSEMASAARDTERSIWSVFTPKGLKDALLPEARPMHLPPRPPPIDDHRVRRMFERKELASHFLQVEGGEVPILFSGCTSEEIAGLSEQLWGVRAGAEQLAALLEPGTGSVVEISRNPQVQDLVKVSVGAPDFYKEIWMHQQEEKPFFKIGAWYKYQQAKGNGAMRSELRSLFQKVRDFAPEIHEAVVTPIDDGLVVWPRLGFGAEMLLEEHHLQTIKQHAPEIKLEEMTRLGDLIGTPEGWALYKKFSYLFRPREGPWRFDLAAGSRSMKTLIEGFNFPAR